jgi:hypothetical protein
MQHTFMFSFPFFMGNYYKKKKHYTVYVEIPVYHMKETGSKNINCTKGEHNKCIQSGLWSSRL